MDTIRDKILTDIRLALKDGVEHTTAKPTDSSLLFKNREGGLVEGFVREFLAIDGNVIRCDDFQQLAEKLTELIKCNNWKNVVAKSAILKKCGEQTQLESISTVVDDENLGRVEVGITDCECLVARTGTIVMSTAQQAGRTFPIYIPKHIVIAHEKQLVYDLGEAIAVMEQRYHPDYPSGWYLVSGPSRTGDIEKTLVLGVHGPVEVYVFILK
ncbi:LutC/YkgG family protein [Parapedobacter soli]|uniref:LutC/YkgG family protein n=1 Tax=Parapedobacter soli TaxID=416955 RepID=UPI0021C78826|nr:LUD domain-containing protein [Parapedobacter soli]